MKKYTHHDSPLGESADYRRQRKRRPRGLRSLLTAAGILFAYFYLIRSTTFSGALRSSEAVEIPTIPDTLWSALDYLVHLILKLWKYYL